MRLRPGEAISGAAAIAFIVLAFSAWFEIGEDTASGWDAFSTVLLIPVVLVLACSVGLLVTTIVGKPVAWSVGLAVLTSFLGIITSMILLLWLAFGPEVDGAGADARWTVWVGTLLFALVPAGSWLAMKDERLDAPYSQYTPPPARPIPGSDT